jgi:RimJ/RimL family protein N-acetyltransferase
VDLQPTLSDHLITVRPLRLDDFEALYAVASDPLLWDQHPCRDRYKREVFRTLFTNRLKTNGALVVSDYKGEKIVGSSGYYHLKRDSVVIGYTFLSRACWGGFYNQSLKRLMLDHAFRFVPKVHFHISDLNSRSQKAIEKFGATRIESFDKAEADEVARKVFIYEITRSAWQLTSI